MVYNMERLVESMDPRRGVESWVWIFDFQGMSYTTSVPISMGKQVLDIVSTAYPERLGLALMVDAPYIFSFFWTAISPLVHPVTKSKIRFCSSTRSGGNTDPAFMEAFEDLAGLEKDFGGTLDCAYDHQAYWESERTDLAASASSSTVAGAAVAANSGEN